jgi:IclR family acetate operon transcriptional repressor
MGIKTADRTLDVFELFAHEQSPMTLSVLAEKMAIPASSAHGLIKTLQSRGYLYEVSRRHGYYLTKKLQRQVDAIAVGSPFLAQMNPYLQQLCDDLSETVLLGKRQGDLVAYLDVIECRQSIRFSPAAGELKSLHCSATGKALLGSLAPEVLSATLARLKLDRRTDKTITSLSKLEAEINGHRRRGWYQVIGENISDVMSIAATVTLEGEAYVVAAGGPIQRFKPLMASHAERLLQTCQRIEQALN